MKIDRVPGTGKLFAAAPPVAPADQATPVARERHSTPSPDDYRRSLARDVALRFGPPLLIAALLTLAALWPRAPFALDVGMPGDRLFLANVHGDERLAEYSYRWTGKNDQPTILTVPGWGAVRRMRVTLRAQTLPEQGTVELRLLANGQLAGTVQVDGVMAERTVEIAIPAGSSADFSLALDTPTTRVAGDNRDLGVKFDTIRLDPLARAGGVYWQTLWSHFAGALAL